MSREHGPSSFRWRSAASLVPLILVLSTGCNAQEPSTSPTMIPTLESTKRPILNSEKPDFSNLSDTEYIKALIKEYFDLRSNSPLKLAIQNLDQDPSSLKRIETTPTGKANEVPLQGKGSRKNVTFTGPIEGLAVKIDEKKTEILFYLTSYGEFAAKPGEHIIGGRSWEEQSRKDTGNVSSLMRHKPSSWVLNSIEDKDGKRVVTMVAEIVSGKWHITYTVASSIKDELAAVSIVIIDP